MISRKEKTVQIPTHEVEVNFFYLHYNDAKKFAEWAESETSKLRSLHARHAILSAVFSSEALANRIVSHVEPNKLSAEGIEKLGIAEKWSLLPTLVLGTPEAKKWFDLSREPFQSFRELVQIRNWLVHPKSGKFVDATYDGQSTITNLDTGKEIPWVETLQGKVWPQTKIPFNPFELTADHAHKAVYILDKLVEELQSALVGSFLSKNWLWEVDLKAKSGSDRRKISVDSLWGGYTPKAS